jgi:hypothetical protein
MDRTEVLELMVQLKLYGMWAVYDEVMAAGIKRHHEPPRILGDLLAEIAEKRARSIEAAGHPHQVRIFERFIRPGQRHHTGNPRGHARCGSRR